MTSVPSSELRDRIAAAIASVTITIGPNSLALLKAGNTLGLSGGEIDAMALSALAEVQAELDRLRAELEQAQQQNAANDRALGVLLHYAAEAHRRKWAFDNGGEGRPSDAFAALHQLGNEIKASVDKITSPAAQSTT